MTVRVTHNSRGLSIRFTGADADRVFKGIAMAMSETAANAPEPIPNRPKEVSATQGANSPQNVPTARHEGQS